jgi:hypothetical protein
VSPAVDCSLAPPPVAPVGGAQTTRRQPSATVRSRPAATAATSGAALARHGTPRKRRQASRAKLATSSHEVGRRGSRVSWRSVGGLCSRRGSPASWNERPQHGVCAVCGPLQAADTKQRGDTKCFVEIRPAAGAPVRHASRQPALEFSHTSMLPTGPISGNGIPASRGRSRRESVDWTPAAAACLAWVGVGCRRRAIQYASACAVFAFACVWAPGAHRWGRLRLPPPRMAAAAAGCNKGANRRAIARISPLPLRVGAVRRVPPAGRDRQACRWRSLGRPASLELIIGGKIHNGSPAMTTAAAAVAATTSCPPLWTRGLVFGRLAAATRSRNKSERRDSSEIMESRELARSKFAPLSAVPGRAAAAALVRFVCRMENMQRGETATERTIRSAAANDRISLTTIRREGGSAARPLERGPNNCKECLSRSRPTLVFGLLWWRRRRDGARNMNDNHLEYVVLVSDFGGRSCSCHRPAWPGPAATPGRPSLGRAIGGRPAANHKSSSSHGQAGRAAITSRGRTI